MVDYCFFQRSLSTRYLIPLRIHTIPGTETPPLLVLKEVCETMVASNVLHTLRGSNITLDHVLDEVRAHANRWSMCLSRNYEWDVSPPRGVLNVLIHDEYTQTAFDRQNNTIRKTKIICTLGPVRHCLLCPHPCPPICFSLGSVPYQHFPRLDLPYIFY